MKVSLTLLLLNLLAGSLAGAHGEENPGPHQGHIRMPGAFHTELVLDDKQEAHIYLLDMNFQNPSVKDSHIELSAQNGKSIVPFQCSIMDNSHFHCIPAKKYPQKGKLVLKATREKMAGHEISYPLPLKPFKGEAKPSSHHTH
ncbi:MAG: hypothetical protein AAGB31_07250 [Bdellovibrio sp.]